MRKIKTLILTFLLASLGAAAQDLDHNTYMFAVRDTCDLYMDVYEPEEAQATVLFVFGGGFVSGRRNDPYYNPWFRNLTAHGYRVVAVDYRLGLKGQQMKFNLLSLIDSAKKTIRAVDIGVEDVFSAINYLNDNAEELGIDMGKIVLAGSSAGAMIALSSEHEICTGGPLASVLPEGFRFLGIMSFAGALMSDTGLPKYDIDPCPHLLFHGTSDGAVTYDKTAFGKYGMFGSSFLVDKVFSKKDYVYNFYRYPGHTHDIAGNFFDTWPEQQRFLENLLAGNPRIVDATIIDPSMMTWEQNITLDKIY
ncbi:MAG: alpha/beta hydrolase [Bacteroidales bacterium]|nr:alpha/beta hydrolase [Bacteroidales bacterium]